MSDALHTILARFREEPDEFFDPEKIIGDLHEKVDAIKYHIESCEAQADMIEAEWISKLISKRDALRNMAENTKKYLREQMILNQWDELPGKMFRAKLQNSMPSLEIPYEPTAQEALRFPKYVRQDTTYKWNKDLIKEEFEQAEIPGAVVRQRKHTRFYVRK